MCWPPCARAAAGPAAKARRSRPRGRPPRPPPARPRSPQTNADRPGGGREHRPGILAGASERMNANRTLSPVWLLSILTGLNLVNYLDRYVMSAVLTPLQKEFGLTDGDLGSVNTIFMIGYF